MGFLDRFRSAAPPPTKPRGGSGRANYGGYQEIEEENFELRHPHGLKKYDRMYRTDPDVRRAVRMVVNPIIGGTWGVEPYGGDEAEDKDREVAEAFEWALFSNMRPGFGGHLAELLPVLVRSGFTPFEEIWEHVKRDGKDLIVPRTLQLKLPRSIERFIPDPGTGELVELKQQLPIGGQVDLPLEDLLYYRLGAEGDNWEGNSLLRATYKPWFLKDKLERIDVIKAERQAMGIPICYPPDNASPEQLKEMEDILGGIRASEQGFIIAPGPHAQDLKELAAAKGWRIEILGIEKGQANVSVQPSLEYHSDKIAGSFIEDFMRLGQGQGASGARATADSQENPFLAACEALAGEVEGPLEDLATRFAALNFDVEEPPKLKMSLVDSTSLTELAEYVGKLVEREAVHPDDELEDFLRKRADLPPADAEAREERKKASEEARALAQKAAESPPAPASVPGDPRPQPSPAPPKPATASKPEPKPKADEDQVLRDEREMRWWEELMSLDEIETAIDNARSRFEAAGGDDARRIASEMADAALAGKTLTPKADEGLQKAIYAELARLYRTGRSTVVDELNAQRPGTRDAAGADEESEARKRLMARARLGAQSIGNRIWQKVSHTVLNGPGGRAAAQKAGEAEAAAGLRAEAQLHAAGALNEGRQDQASIQSDEIEGARYTSILDRTRCDQCALADDDVLRKLDDPVRIEHIPPNQDCYGGGRCRCMEFYELEEEAPGYGGGPAPPEPPLAPPEGPGGLAAEHYEVDGGSPQMQALIADQLAAIDKVHRIPASMPVVPIKIRPTLDSGKGKRLGQWGGGLDVEGNWHDEQIKLSAQALRLDPPFPSAVHEIGHSLDSHGFGDGTPIEAIMRGGFQTMYSSTPAMTEWRNAVTTSTAYRNLVAEGDGYRESITELLARSYEQYIALRSGNKVLLAKIAKRMSDDSNVYWSDADFEPIADVFDRFFAARGLTNAG
ncbi:MAG TPA: hypothetical protein VGC63_04995 [Solirubrobacterales bacterium]|jgi:hypothetical protein